MRSTLAVCAAVVILLGGCGGDPAPTDTASTTPAATAPAGAVNDVSVPWEDYAPTVKQDIDAMTADKDCTGLQAEFNTADANNQSTMNRTGHSNADLMAYIDNAMKIAGCY